MRTGGGEKGGRKRGKIQYRTEVVRKDKKAGRGTIRYDTRCYINVRSKANISQLNLPHGTDN